LVQYRVAVQQKVRLGVKAFVSLGTPSNYIALLHNGDKVKCERAARTSALDGSCALSNKFSVGQATLGRPGKRCFLKTKKSRGVILAR